MLEFLDNPLVQIMLAGIAIIVGIIGIIFIIALMGRIVIPFVFFKVLCGVAEAIQTALEFAFTFGADKDSRKDPPIFLGVFLSIVACIVIFAAAAYLVMVGEGFLTR